MYGGVGIGRISSELSKRESDYGLRVCRKSIDFHAGTKMDGDQIFTNGGRVLNVVGSGDSLQEAIDQSYTAIKRIHFEDSFYRSDIGAKGLKHL